MNNKIIIILLSLGALVILFFGIDLARNRADKRSEFDFSGITRPLLYNESPSKGQGELAIYEYADFSCASCKAMRPIMRLIMEKYSSQARHVWKDFPFLAQSSRDAAIAARCAHEQGKFWEYHDWIFENQNVLAPVSFETGARALSLDIAGFTSCMLDDTISALVERDFQEAQALGINTTPTIVIGDVALVGVVEFEDIERAILNAISK
ncbi:thioredoxin domain-containing protein [Patescibacteria group bacterium]|nr:thioredoxin domain-containing protein [Patescibacteria group bacterium]